MIIIENVTIYKCEFCKKELKQKHAMEKHERRCERSPEIEKACFGCKHLDTIEKWVWFDGYYGDDGCDKKVNVFHCRKLDKLMFPYSIEKRDLHNRFPETYEGQEAMPNKCNDLIIQEDFLSKIFE